MAQISVNTQPPTRSQRSALKVARVLLFAVGYFSIALVGTPGGDADSAAFGVGAHLLNHFGYAAVFMLYPMTWLGGIMAAYVLVAVQTISCLAMFRFNGARPRRSGANIAAVGTQMSSSQYLSIIVLPIFLSLLVAFGLLAVMPTKLPIKFIPFPIITQGALAFAVGIYLGGSADSLKTFVQVLRLPRSARIVDEVRGFSYEI